MANKNSARKGDKTTPTAVKTVPSTGSSNSQNSKKQVSGFSGQPVNAGLTSSAPSDALALAAASLGIVDSVGNNISKNNLHPKDIPDNLKNVIKDLMDISSGIVSDNKSTKMAAVAAMKKKFAELGLFSWLDIADDGTVRNINQLAAAAGVTGKAGKGNVDAAISAVTNALLKSNDGKSNAMSPLEDLVDKLIQKEADDFVEKTKGKSLSSLPMTLPSEPKNTNRASQTREDPFKGIGSLVEGEWFEDPETGKRMKAHNVQTASRLCTCGDEVCRQYIIKGYLSTGDDPLADSDFDSDLEYLLDPDNDLNAIDPVKLQVVQNAEQELSSIYSMFESKQVTEEEKLSVLKRKYMELMQQDIKHRLESIRARESISQAEMERDAATKELEKMNAVKMRLDSLCKDLQEENRRIKAEIMKRPEVTNKCRIKGGCSRCGCTLDLSAAFPSLPILPDIPVLQKAGARQLAEQLVKFVDIYRLRERHFKALIRAKESEADHQLARILQLEMTSDGQKQRVEAYERQIAIFGKAEAELKAQLAIYVDKFKQVEETLGKSNDLFATFRREMEQMTLKLSRLENENHQLQSKCNTLSRNIIEMADERTKQSASYETMKAQKGKLEQLCRKLQEERKAGLVANNDASPEKNDN